jgi:hypothetical protein
MSLRSFHVVFIAASTLLAFFYATWCLVLGDREGLGWRAAGAASAAAGLGLVAYEAWFLRRTAPREDGSAFGAVRGHR